MRGKRPFLSVARVLIAGMAALSGLDARAQAATATPQLWLNPGIVSRHFNRSKDLREDNFGLGAEALLARDHALMAGSFINSDRTRSRYAAYQWRPLHRQAAGLEVSAGIALGGFDGYPRYRGGRWFPAALPVLSIEGERVGVNVFLVPTIADRLHGAVALQFKLRVW